MAGPFTYPVADSLPFDADTSRNSAVGGSVQDFIDRVSAPTNTVSPTYLPNGNLSALTLYRNTTQINANRSADCTVTYDLEQNPTSEIWRLFDSDGVTVLKTISLTHIWSLGNYIRTETVTS